MALGDPPELTDEYSAFGPAAPAFAASAQIDLLREYLESVTVVALRRADCWEKPSQPTLRSGLRRCRVLLTAAGCAVIDSSRDPATIEAKSLRKALPSIL
jgi:hypothetical protein